MLYEVITTVTADLVEDLLDGAGVAAVEGVFGVAPGAAQGAAGQANEHGGQADPAGLALNGSEDFRHPEAGDGRVFTHGRIPCSAAETLFGGLGCCAGGVLVDH